jgi:uncharacterized lipoprotein YajG
MLSQSVKNRRFAAPLLILISVVFLVSACTPTFHSTIKIPRVPVKIKQTSITRRPQYGMTIFIDQMVDARKKEALAEYDGRDINPDGDVTGAVLDALRSGLEQKGFKYTDTAPVIISGEIRTWFTRIENGFTRKATADAALYLEVIDPTNKRVYSGIYRGYSSIEKPGLGEEEVSKALGSSMAEAVNQALSDQQLIRLISAF